MFSIISFILFLIVFAETGLVVTPLLPGDSLLFAAGALAAPPDNPLNVFYLMIIFFFAAFGGDNTNYFIGNYIGPKVFEKKMFPDIQGKVFSPLNFH